MKWLPAVFGLSLILAFVCFGVWVGSSIEDPLWASTSSVVFLIFAASFAFVAVAVGIAMIVIGLTRLIGQDAKDRSASNG